MKRRILRGNRGENPGGVVPTEGLISYYNLATDANDYYGTNHGVNSGVIFSNGEASFNGGANIILPANIYSNPTALSLCLFLKADNQASEYRAVTINNNTGGVYISVRIKTDNTVGVWHNSPNLSLTGSVVTTNKFHIGFTLQKTGVYELFINAQKVAEGISTGSFSQVTDALTNRIGSARNGTLGFKGKGSKMALYNKVLSAAEFSNLYNNGNGVLM